MTPRLTIEWRHHRDPARYLPLCPDTGRRLQDVIDEIATLLGPRGIEVEFIEQEYTDDAPGKAQMLLFDGIPLEELVPPRRRGGPCFECTVCGPRQEECGACEEVDYYMAVPESVIRLAALKAAGMKS